MRFTKIGRIGWDKKLKTCLDEVECEKPVLTCYPPGYMKEEFYEMQTMVDQNPLVMTLLCFHEELEIPIYQKTKILKNWDLLPKFYKSHFWAGGFSFSSG